MTILVQRSDVGEFRRRYRWSVIAVLLVFAVFVGRLVELQVIDGEIYHAQARRNIVRTQSLATTRGVIRDAYGRILASNRPSYNVYVVPSKMDLETLWPKAARLLGLGDADRTLYAERIRAIQSSTEPSEQKLKDQQLLLIVDVDRDVVATLKTHLTELRNSIDVVPVPVRAYPYGEIGAHVLGYMRELDKEALERLRGRGYRSGDKLGAIGVERRWESYLRGERGWRKLIGGAEGRKNREELDAKYLEEPRLVEPVPGRDLSLTLDIDLMRAVERAMRGQLAGAVVVVDVRTGRLLAALSKPSFDPNIASGGTGKAAVGEMFRRLLADPLKPTLDKTISAAYPPGSTYKPFSALAGLAERVISPRSEADCRGGYEYGRRFFRCTGVHRRVNLSSAIIQSCNTYFYQLGEQLSVDRLAKIGTDFGFGAKTGIGVNPEARGSMPTHAWYARRYKGFRGGFKLYAAIGQGASTVTVLQLALAYAALANGGTVYQPQVVRSIETSDGTIVQEFPPRVRRMVGIDPENSRLVNEALEGVVTDTRGTAYKERLTGVDLAGKTATAQVTQVTPRGVDPKKIWYFNREHAWFAGYAPADAPEIAFAVLIEHGGAGGKNAVPVAMRIVRDWQDLQTERRRALSQRTTP